MDRTDLRVARLRGFLSADASNAELACELADALFAEGDYPGAGTMLQSLPPEAGEAPGVRFRLARVALVAGDFAAAADICHALIEAGHDGVAIWHDLAFSQLCQRDPDAAMGSAREGVARHGDAPAMAVLRARIWLRQGQAGLALASADEALAMDSEDSTAQGVRALVLLDSNELERAGAASRRCLAGNPEQHEALLVTGTLALWRQDLDEAQAAFQRALARHANSGRALSGLGQVWMMRNALPQARETLRAAVDAMPDHIGTWHALAWTNLLLGNRTEAEADYRSAFALDRNFGDNHGGLALVAVLKGELDTADAAVKRALRLDPAAMTARYAQALLLEARGDTAGSEMLMSELLQSGGQTGSALPVREFAYRLKHALQAGS